MSALRPLRVTSSGAGVAANVVHAANTAQPSRHDRIRIELSPARLSTADTIEIAPALQRFLAAAATGAGIHKKLLGVIG
jgi:hypothetical protein